MFNLRHYQETAVNTLRQRWKENDKFVLLVSDVGTGKTIIFCYIAYHALMKNPNTSVVIAVNRDKLANQAIQRLKSFGMNPYKYIAAPIPTYKHRLIVTSAQTMRSRGFVHGNINIIDEVHYGDFKPFHQYLKSLPIQPYVLGCTATPENNEANTLAEFYNPEWLTTLTTQQHIQEDNILEPIFARPNITIDRSQIKSQKTQYGTDYNAKQSFKALDRQVIYDNLIEQYISLAYPKQALCFCQSKEHALVTYDKLRYAGITCDVIFGDSKNQADIFARFEAKKFKVLVAVNVGSVGYDYPELSVLIINRLIKSQCLWMQMLGRVTRPFPRKDTPLVIDMGDNVGVGGMGGILTKRDWKWTAKKSKKEKGVAPKKTCKVCKALLAPTQFKCHVCGFELPKPELAASNQSAEFVIWHPANITIPEDFLSLPFDIQKQIIFALDIKRRSSLTKDGKRPHHNSIIHALKNKYQDVSMQQKVLDIYAKATNKSPFWRNKAESVFFKK